jgi:hypothetical protein
MQPPRTGAMTMTNLKAFGLAALLSAMTLAMIYANAGLP